MSLEKNKNRSSADDILHISNSKKSKFKEIFLSAINKKKKKKREKSDSFIKLGDGTTFHHTGNDICRLIERKHMASLFNVDRKFFVKVYDANKTLERTLAIERAHKVIGLHPNILQLIERTHFKHSKFISFKFDFIHGTDLVNYLIQYKGAYLPESLCKWIIKETLRALVHIHSKGYIHGDLSLDNIMWCEKTNNILVCDFEFAEPWLPGKLRTKDSGSLYFASPEIMTLSPLEGPEADVWAIGVIAFACMFRTFPWESDDNETIRLNIVENNWRFPTAFRRTSNEFRNFVNSCLCTDPSQRLTSQELLMHSWITNCTNLSSSKSLDCQNNQSNDDRYSSSAAACSSSFT